MRTLVTGGCGFIGSHIVEQLLDDGHSVVVLDNFSTGRLQNTASMGNGDLTVIESDVSDYKAILPYFKDVDWVFHLAALADIVPSIENPLNYHNSNVNGTISVLEASRQSGVKRFIYAASSSCYGIPDSFPTSESAAIRPQYPYATTKYVGELYAMNWNRIYNLPVTSLRFFNVYGTRSRTSGTYGAVFGVFLAQKLTNQPFTVVGDGTQTRDFTYVSDVANACIGAAKSDRVIGEILNVGSGNTYSVNKLVELLGGDKVYIPKRPGEPDCTFADITKIKKLLGWEPKVSLKEGVHRMLDNIDYWKDAPIWDKEKINAATKDWFKYLG